MHVFLRDAWGICTRIVRGSSISTAAIVNSTRCQDSHMMTSSNGNIFRVTGHLCGEFTGHRWIPRTKASGAELWYFLWSCLYDREAGDLRRHRTHYDGTVMHPGFFGQIGCYLTTENLTTKRVHNSWHTLHLSSDQGHFNWRTMGSNS